MSEVRYKEGDLVARRFKILRSIGRGGMGAVFLADDKQLDREVALKFLLLGGISDEDRVEALKRFSQEIKLMANKAFRHPNIIEGYDMGVTEDGLPFYVMEYYDAKSLYEYAKAKGGLQTELHRVMADVARALAHVHPKGVVHRDLKPDNILVGAEGAKVADFGTAKLASNNLTVANSFFGSFNYCSPEQVLTYEHGEDVVDSRADIYSYGATFYQVLTGRIPHQKSHSTRTQSIFRRVLEEGLAPIREVNASVPESIASIIEACLIKDKEKRIPDAAAVLARLMAVPDDDWKAIRWDHVASAGSKMPMTPEAMLEIMAGTAVRPATPAAVDSDEANRHTRKLPPKGGPAAVPGPQPVSPNGKAPSNLVAEARAASGDGGTEVGDPDEPVRVPSFELDSAVRRKPSGAPTVKSGPPPGPAKDTATERKMPRGVKVGLLLALLLVFGAGVFLILQQQEDENRDLADARTKAQAEVAPEKVRASDIHATLSESAKDTSNRSLSDETAMLANSSTPGGPPSVEPPVPVPQPAAVAPAPPVQVTPAPANDPPMRKNPPFFDERNVQGGNRGGRGPGNSGGDSVPTTPPRPHSTAMQQPQDEAAYYMPSTRGQGSQQAVVGFGKGKKGEVADSSVPLLGVKITTVFNAELIEEFDSLSQGIPVQAKLTGEFLQDGRVIFPRGTRFLGAPGGVTPNNRVQVQFHTILTPDGQEIPFSGVAQSADGGVGIAGFLDYDYAKRAVGHAVSGALSGASSKVADVYGKTDGPGSTAAQRTSDSLESDAESANEKRKREDLVNIHLNKGTAIRIFVNRTF